ncbi:MAG: CheR family methyltransferase, partial [Lysobacteraceae bacterium]
MTLGGIGQRDFEYTDRDFRQVCDLIRKRVGIALTDSKRDMVYSRLSRRLRTLGLSSFDEYLADLQSRHDDDEEWQHFTNALTTNLTSFFRESHHFEVLADQLRGLKGRGGTIELWCCAASTGEEPYSILITACEVFGTLKPPVRLWATDVDTQVLETASRGVYAVDRIAGLS